MITRLVIGPLLFLRDLLHLWSGVRGVCRFQPTCVQYAQQAIEEKGIITGGFAALRRILRCHPWSKGGIDPVVAKISCGGLG